MTQLQDRIRESVERTRREASRLPLEQARQRRTQGVSEVRRIIEATEGVPLRVVGQEERTATMLRAVIEGGRR